MGTDGADSLEKLRLKHDAGEPFRVIEIVLSEADCEVMVALRANPKRFYPAIFNGDWARPSEHPMPGIVRILRVIPGEDGVTRVIGRQGDTLYVFPWLG
jgi:hypothetical protein